jgi:polar amino acid transport system substrate-binding protein
MKVFLFASHMILGLSILAASFARAEKSPELRVVTEEFRPYNYADMGVPRGISTEIVQATLAHAGLTAEIEFFPWPRAYLYAQELPNTLIYSIARIPERENLFAWIGSIAKYRTSLYKLRSRTDIEIVELADARRYTVGVSQDDVFSTYLKGQGFKDLEVSREDEIAIGMLAFERVDLVALDEAAFKHQVEASGIDPSEIVRVFRIDDLTGELYLAAQRNSDPSLVKKLRDSLRALKDSGELDAISSRYFGGP